MAGSLNAGVAEIAWVATGYTLAAVIVLPMTAFLAERFGRKRYLLASILVFTAASLMCGILNNLVGVVLCRILQGAGGAALTSTSQAALIEIFPEEEQEKVQMYFLLGLITAPVFGPMLGGWLTDNLSWHWCFLVNVPIGITAAAMLSIYLKDSVAPKNSEPVDWPGIALLTVGLGSLQYVLEEGQRCDWFNDNTIVLLTVTSCLCLAFLVYWQLSPHNQNPVVNLKVLRSRSVTAGIVLFATVGFEISGISYLYSLLAQDVQGLSPWQTGLALAPGGVGIALSIMLCGMATNKWGDKVDVRLIALGGATLSAIALWQFGHLSPGAGIDNTFWPLLLRGVSMGLLVVPINMAVIAGLKPGEVQQGMALTNLADQLGGSFGIAILASSIAGHLASHRADMIANFSSSNLLFAAQATAISSVVSKYGYSPFSAKQVAVSMLDHLLAQQALTMSYNDAFLLMLGFVLLTTPALLLLKKAAA